jgi:hypothetical protein
MQATGWGDDFDGFGWEMGVGGKLGEVRDINKRSRV